jgi:two-component system, NtrC family, sensor kinase
MVEQSGAAGRRASDQQSTSAVVWHQSLRLRAILATLLLAAWIGIGVYLIMAKQARPYFEQQAYRLIEQTGNTVVSMLNSRLLEITALNRSVAATATILEKSEPVFMAGLPPVINFGGDAGVAGGGFWPEPHTFAPDAVRRAFFWGRNSANVLEYQNGPNEVPSAYFNEEWYFPARFEKADSCYWSASYVDPHTFEPMVTCTTPLFADGKFTGAASLDMRLAGLAELTAQWARQTGGYIFLVDRSNRFISFGDDAMIRRAVVTAEGVNTQEFLNAAQVSAAHPEFASISQILQAMDTATVAAARQENSLPIDDVARAIQTNLVGGRDSIDEAGAQLTAAALADPYRNTYSLHATTLVRTQALDGDPVLKVPTVLFLFHVPHAYWKLGIVKPQREITAVADSITNYLILYLLATVLAALVLAYFMFNRWLLTPVQKISSAVRQMSALIGLRRHHELRRFRLASFGQTEIGVLGRDINAFADEITLSEGKLAEANTLLERRVQERTEELSGALNQLKNSQAQLVQSEKMASLGQMVAGIAHEINTPLGYVKNNVMLSRDLLGRYFELAEQAERLAAQPRVSPEQLQETLACAQLIRADNVSDDSRQLIADALYGVEQISELVNDLRNFSRLDEAKIKDVSVHECIDSALNIVRNQLKSKVEVIKEYGTLPNLACSPSQINQVFVNLFNNSAQAMDGPGKIHIQTNCDADFVHIAVRDNGRGIPKETLGRIFEPFFTTKPVGQGTGLGLSITFQIVQRHGGHIRVASEPGRGTRFVVSLPVQARKQAA